MPDTNEEVQSHLRQVQHLLLDDRNPRLPEDLHGKPQRRLLEYLYETGNLTELAQSFVDNDFFKHEPLIVLKANGKQRVVVEGNRRLATLLIVLDLPIAEGLRFPDLKVTASHRKALQEVPCFEVSSQDEVYRFLGFRHIGGIKTWSSEAKARYIYREVEDEVSVRLDEVFAAVSRRTGLDTGAIRTSYLAYALIYAARDKLGIDTSRLLAHDERRFGVWIRAMQSPDVRAHLGLADVTTYSDIQKSLRKLNKKTVREVIDDIAPPPGVPLVIPDSRQVTLYGQVLRNEDAHDEMRRTRSLDTAQAIVARERLPVRLQKIVRQVTRLATDVLGAEKADIEELKAEYARLQDASERLAKAIRGVAQA